MAKIRMSSSEMELIDSYLTKAILATEEATSIWGENFDNLYWNFKESGFLDDLYKDAESQYYHLANLGFVVSYTAQGFGIGAGVGAIAGTVVPVLGNIAIGTIGGIIGAVIGFFTGIYHCVKNPNSVKWSYVSQQVFVDLLYLCSCGGEDNYVYLYDTLAKIESVKASMLELKTKINEFQQVYANLNSTADIYGLKTILASDGVTMLGVDTEVTINNQKIKLSVSEAMNALFTYENAVMSAEIEADYMNRTYGTQFNYANIVENANGFMTNTITSGLYSHEFVKTLLPSYISSYGDTVIFSKPTSDPTFSSILDSASVVGTLGSSASLVGAGFLGSAISNVIPPVTNTGNNTSSGQGSSSGNGSSSGSGSSGGNGTSAGNGSNGNATQPEQTPLPEEKKEEEVVLPPLEEISKEEVPEELESIVEIDYDDLARAEYEAQDEDELNEHINEVMNEALTLYENGDFDIIRKRLTEFGYSEPEIDSILRSQEYVTMAFIEGDRRDALTEIANRLADEDGIKDFDTSYDDGQEYSDLVNGTNSTLLVNMSQDKDIIKMREGFQDTEEKYKASLLEANESVSKAQEAKKVLDEVQKKLGSDTKDWTVEDAENYNKIVREYNEVLKDANQKVALSNEAKEKYIKAKDSYIKAKKDFLEEIRKNKLNENKTEESTKPPLDSGASNTPNQPSSGQDDVIHFTDEDALQFVQGDGGSISIE